MKIYHYYIVKYKIMGVWRKYLNIATTVKQLFCSEFTFIAIPFCGKSELAYLHVHMVSLHQ